MGVLTYVFTGIMDDAGVPGASYTTSIKEIIGPHILKQAENVAN
jgi:hypothetical protein